MKNNFFLKDEFLIWLKDDSNLTLESAKSYCSYISNASKLVSFVEDKSKSKDALDLFTVIRESTKGDEILVDVEDLINSIIVQFSILDADKVYGKTKKTLQNYKSGLSKYLDFLINQGKYYFEQEKEFKDSFTLLTKKNIEDCDIVLSQKDLINIFKLRIKTQDRIYSDIFFPIRLINRTFRIQKKQKLFSKWLTEIINDIKIHLGNNIIKFKDISGLVISEKKVYILLKNNTKERAFTMLSDNITAKEFEVNKISKISIDHVKPLHTILNDNIHNFPTIGFLTKTIKDYYKIEKVKIKQLRELSSSDKIDDKLGKIPIDNLLKELYFILEETDLQLMDRVQNTSKGKK